tara:strand:+ start:84 stop:383 length:300 start_codon:yes stop_codon:yes gene_type:complete
MNGVSQESLEIAQRIKDDYNEILDNIKDSNELRGVAKEISDRYYPLVFVDIKETLKSWFEVVVDISGDEDKARKAWESKRDGSFARVVYPYDHDFPTSL